MKALKKAGIFVAEALMCIPIMGVVGLVYLSSFRPAASQAFWLECLRSGPLPASKIPAFRTRRFPLERFIKYGLIEVDRAPGDPLVQLSGYARELMR